MPFYRRPLNSLLLEVQYPGCPAPNHLFHRELGFLCCGSCGSVFLPSNTDSASTKLFRHQQRKHPDLQSSQDDTTPATTTTANTQLSRKDAFLEACLSLEKKFSDPASFTQNCAALTLSIHLNRFPKLSDLVSTLQQEGGPPKPLPPVEGLVEPYPGNFYCTERGCHFRGSRSQLRTHGLRNSHSYTEDKTGSPPLVQKMDLSPFLPLEPDDASGPDDGTPRCAVVCFQVTMEGDDGELGRCSEDPEAKRVIEVLSFPVVAKETTSYLDMSPFEHAAQLDEVLHRRLAAPLSTFHLNPVLEKCKRRLVRIILHVNSRYERDGFSHPRLTLGMKQDVMNTDTHSVHAKSLFTLLTTDESRKKYALSLANFVIFCSLSTPQDYEIDTLVGGQKGPTRTTFHALRRLLVRDCYQKWQKNNHAKDHCARDGLNNILADNSVEGYLSELEKSLLAGCVPKLSDAAAVLASEACLRFGESEILEHEEHLWEEFLDEMVCRTSLEPTAEPILHYVVLVSLDDSGRRKTGFEISSTLAQFLYQIRLYTLYCVAGIMEGIRETELSPGQLREQLARPHAFIETHCRRGSFTPYSCVLKKYFPVVAASRNAELLPRLLDLGNGSVQVGTNGPILSASSIGKKVNDLLSSAYEIMKFLLPEGNPVSQYIPDMSTDDDLERYWPRENFPEHVIGSYFLNRAYEEGPDNTAAYVRKFQELNNLVLVLIALTSGAFCRGTSVLSLKLLATQTGMKGCYRRANRIVLLPSHKKQNGVERARETCGAYFPLPEVGECLFHPNFTVLRVGWTALEAYREFSISRDRDRDASETKAAVDEIRKSMATHLAIHGTEPANKDYFYRTFHKLTSGSGIGENPEGFGISEFRQFLEWLFRNDSKVAAARANMLSNGHTSALVENMQHSAETAQAIYGNTDSGRFTTHHFKACQELCDHGNSLLGLMDSPYDTKFGSDVSGSSQPRSWSVTTLANPTHLPFSHPGSVTLAQPSFSSNSGSFLNPSLSGQSLPKGAVPPQVFALPPEVTGYAAMSQLSGWSPPPQPGRLRSCPMEGYSTLQEIPAVLSSLGFPSLLDSTQAAMVSALVNHRGPGMIFAVSTGGGKTLGPIVVPLVERRMAMKSHLPTPVTVMVTLLRGVQDQLVRDLQRLLIPHHVVTGTNTREVPANGVAHVVLPLENISSFFGTMTRLSGEKRLRRIVVDECHLGHDMANFRKAVEDLKMFSQLGCPVFGMSGSLPHDLVQSTALRIGIASANPPVISNHGMNPRNRIRYHFVATPSEAMEKTVGFLADLFGADTCSDPRYIVFCPTVKRVGEVFLEVRRRVPVGTCFFYHGRLDSKDKAESLFGWNTMKGSIMVATTALIAGIHHPYVSGIVFDCFVRSYSDMVQGIGRGSRSPGSSCEVRAFFLNDPRSIENMIGPGGLHQIDPDIRNDLFDREHPVEKCCRRYALTAVTGPPMTCALLDRSGFVAPRCDVCEGQGSMVKESVSPNPSPNDNALLCWNVNEDCFRLPDRLSLSTEKVHALDSPPLPHTEKPPVKGFITAAELLRGEKHSTPPGPRTPPSTLLSPLPGCHHNEPTSPAVPQVRRESRHSDSVEVAVTLAQFHDVSAPPNREPRGKRIGMVSNPSRKRYGTPPHLGSPSKHPRTAGSKTRDILSSYGKKEAPLRESDEFGNITPNRISWCRTANATEGHSDSRSPANHSRYTRTSLGSVQTLATIPGIRRTSTSTYRTSTGTRTSTGSSSSAMTSSGLSTNSVSYGRRLPHHPPLSLADQKDVSEQYLEAYSAWIDYLNTEMADREYCIRCTFMRMRPAYCNREGAASDSQCWSKTCWECCQFRCFKTCGNPREAKRRLTVPGIMCGYCLRGPCPGSEGGQSLLCSTLGKKEGGSALNPEQFFWNIAVHCFRKIPQVCAYISRHGRSKEIQKDIDTLLCSLTDLPTADAVREMSTKEFFEILTKRSTNTRLNYYVIYVMRLRDILFPEYCNERRMAPVPIKFC